MIEPIINLKNKIISLEGGGVPSYAFVSSLPKTTLITFVGTYAIKEVTINFNVYPHDGNAYDCFLVAELCAYNEYCVRVWDAGNNYWRRNYRAYTYLVPIDGHNIKLAVAVHTEERILDGWRRVLRFAELHLATRAITVCEHGFAYRWRLGGVPRPLQTACFTSIYRNRVPIEALPADLQQMAMSYSNLFGDHLVQSIWRLYL